MTDTALTPIPANDVARPEPPPSRGNWIDTIMRHAPKLTKAWGGYRAFVAVITFGAFLTLPLVRDWALVAITIIVLAAMWSPLIAKKLGILD